MIRVAPWKQICVPHLFKSPFVDSQLIEHKHFSLLWHGKPRFLIRVFFCLCSLLILFLLSIFSNTSSIYILNYMETLPSLDTSNIQQLVHIINNVSSNCQMLTIILHDQITKSPVSVSYLGHGFKRQLYSDFYSFVWSIAQTMLTII